ncbi:MAG TPA: DinB family protein [Gemmatimonadaceae bacterium]|nr:DinB family protein [Gemmatimonadaceae bacterium]
MSIEPDYAIDLRTTVDAAATELHAVPADLAAVRPAPGKWSIKEIIGHLIDSASHNHQRFVRARWQDDLVFEGYQQDDWVTAEDYQAASWDDLVTLWHTYNRHVARVMSMVPGDVATRAHRRHNLDEIAWQTVPATESATLEYFMRDYVAHLKHHLRQVSERRASLR